LTTAKTAVSRVELPLNFVSLLLVTLSPTQKLAVIDKGSLMVAAVTLKNPASKNDTSPDKTSVHEFDRDADST
jgi:hypothetical protein